MIVLNDGDNLDPEILLRWSWKADGPTPGENENVRSLLPGLLENWEIILIFSYKW